MPFEPLEEYMKLLKQRDPEKHEELAQRGRQQRSERMHQRRAMAWELHQQGLSSRKIAEALTRLDPQRPVSLRTVQNYLTQCKRA